MENEKWEKRSDEVQEVLEQTPRWIIHWGVTVLFGVVLVILLGSWFFKYPETITAPITITTENPPTSIISRTSGKITRLFIDDKQKVSTNQHLAYIENPAKYHHYIELKESLADLNRFAHFDSIYLNTVLKSDFELGELQTGYSSFKKHFSEYRDYMNLNFHQRNINSIRTQIRENYSYLLGLEEQFNIIKRQFKLEEKQLSRDSLLWVEGLISDVNYEESEKLFLQTKYSLQNVNNSITSIQIRIKELEQIILDNELDYSRQKTKLENELISQYDILLGQLAQFEHKYLLKSPIKGYISFTKYWSTNQNVALNELVFTVVPFDPNEIIGKVLIPYQRSGKVKVGLKVIIKLENYQYTEYGFINGTVESISLVPSENSYILEVSLTNGLNSNYGIELPFMQKMHGTAEIITEEIRLLERLIQPIKYIIKKGFLRQGKNSD